MRLIGGKDYYDHGLAYGVDESVVLVRTGRQVVDIDFPVAATGGAPSVVAAERNGGDFSASRFELGGRSKHLWKHRGMQFSIDGVHVVFCGRYYSGARVRYTADNSWSNKDYVSKAGGEGFDRTIPYRGWHSETFWDMNSLGRFLAKHGARVQNTRLGRLSSWDSRNRDTRYKPFSSRKLEEVELSRSVDMGVAVATLTGDDRLKDDRYGQNFEYRDPKRAQERAAWRVNEPTLGGLDFIKVVDPVTAFQELSMWVGGVLPRSGNPMVQITDDKVKLAKHGMDQYSFKKLPQKAR